MATRLSQDILKNFHSVGVAVRKDDMENFGSLLKAADQGVYAAKRDGKNCVSTP